MWKKDNEIDLLSPSIHPLLQDLTYENLAIHKITIILSFLV